MKNLQAGAYLWSKFVPRERHLDACYRRDGPGWRLYPNPSEPSPVNTIGGVESLKLMTLNMWFDIFAWQERLTEILRLIHLHQPDIICLQEVTPRVLGVLSKPNSFPEGMVCSDLTGYTCEAGYGVVMFSRFSPLAIREVTLPSELGRNLLLFDFRLNGHSFTIGTVHLESLDSGPVRNHQLRICEEYLRPATSAVLLGDFNFDSDFNYYEDDTSPLENLGLQEVMPRYSDIWAALHPDKVAEGKTFDSERNRMIHGYHKTEQMRYDRCMLRSEVWKATKIEMLGTEPFAKVSGRPVHISDHFGLLTELRYTLPPN